MSGVEILLSDSRGNYIPQHFCVDFDLWLKDVEPEDIETCKAGPESEFYWDAWEQILKSAIFIDQNDNVWRLYQDGDLFAFCEKLMTDEEYYNLFGEHRFSYTENNLQTPNLEDITVG